MSTRDDNPKVFISYSWSNPKHEEFVLNLAERLMADGVHILLDKWDLKEGHDKYTFMEKMVTDPDVAKVLIISDSKYATKADSRAGGVGTESQIISNEVYSKTTQEKFIPVVTEYIDGVACLPAFLKARIYVDLATDEVFFDEYEKLLRNIFSRPKIVKPVLGKAPSFLFDENPISVNTASIFSSLKDSIEKEKKSYKRLVKSYLSKLLESIESFRITETSEEIDERVVESINDYKPYRDQFAELVELLCDYGLVNSCRDEIFSFFENSLALNEASSSMSSYNEMWFDNFKYMNQELYLYFITILIKSSEFDEIEFFLTEKYFNRGIRGQKVKDFTEFNSHISVLDERRKSRLKMNRISITADMLHDSANFKGISFDLLMQTDFILCIRSILNLNDYYNRWFPRTLVYKGRWGSEAFELFLRAESKSHFEVVKKLLLIKSKADLVEKFSAADKAYNLQNWRFGYDRIPFESYLNIELLYNG